MAILKKRTSSRQLPNARGLDRAPLDSIIRGVDNAPALTGRGSSSITSAGGSGGSNAVQSAGSANRPFTSAFTNPNTARPTLTTKTSSTPKTALTPKTTLAPKTSLTTKTTTTPKTTLAPKTTLTSKTTPTTKPTITNKTTTTPTTKTTSPTSVVKPSVKPNISNPNSTTNKVVNALTGAAIGAGTKLLVDKITGKPVVRPPTGTTVPKAPAGGGAGNTAGGSKVPNAPAGDKKNPPTSVVKPPVGGGSLISADELYKGALADPSLGLPSGAIDNGDGTYTVGNTTYSMENDSVLYTTNEDGKISVGGNAATDEEVRLAQEDGLSAGETMIYNNGTTITALDDGKGGIMYVPLGMTKKAGLGQKVVVLAVLVEQLLKKLIMPLQMTQQTNLNILKIH